MKLILMTGIILAGLSAMADATTVEGGWNDPSKTCALCTNGAMLSNSVGVLNSTTGTNAKKKPVVPSQKVKHQR